MTAMNLTFVFASLPVGMIATATLDLWALLLNRVLGLPMTNWAIVGRWVASLVTASHWPGPVSAVPAVAGERLLGWLTHYAVGITYAAAYLAGLSALSELPRLYSAVLFGIATVLAPWLILQPGLGLGFFASRAPRPVLTRTLNLLAHIVFGVGLFIGWRAVTLVL